MTLAIRWRVPDRKMALRWRGPSGMSQAILRNPAAPIAAIIGPPGPAGPQGAAGAGAAPLRINAPLASTWVLSHSLGRVPTVQVYLESGEQVIADLQASATQITVTFPSPQAGFVLAF